MNYTLCITEIKLLHSLFYSLLDNRWEHFNILCSLIPRP